MNAEYEAARLLVAGVDAMRGASPIALHWLGDRESADATRHAMDMTGCVMYFEQQSDCLQFMRWVEALASPPSVPGMERELNWGQLVQLLLRAMDTSPKSEDAAALAERMATSILDPHRAAIAIDVRATRAAPPSVPGVERERAIRECAEITSKSAGYVSCEPTFERGYYAGREKAAKEILALIEQPSEKKS
jgi:hypothetical protein